MPFKFLRENDPAKCNQSEISRPCSPAKNSDRSMVACYNGHFIAVYAQVAFPLSRLTEKTATLPTAGRLLRFLRNSKRGTRGDTYPGVSGSISRRVPIYFWYGHKQSWNRNGVITESRRTLDMARREFLVRVSFPKFAVCYRSKRSNVRTVNQAVTW